MMEIKDLKCCGNCIFRKHREEEYIEEWCEKTGEFDFSSDLCKDWSWDKLTSERRAI